MRHFMEFGLDFPTFYVKVDAHLGVSALPERYRVGFFWETTSRICGVFSVIGTTVGLCLHRFMRQSWSPDVVSTCPLYLAVTCSVSTPYEEHSGFIGRRLQKFIGVFSLLGLVRQCIHLHISVLVVSGLQFHEPVYLAVCCLLSAPLEEHKKSLIAGR